MSRNPPAWDTACPDWQERIRTGRSLLPTLPLIKSEADRAVAIFDRLRLPDVEGTPRIKDAAGEWARDIVRGLFGSYDPEEGKRHIREVFELVPKKNSKTTYGAAIMLTAVFMSRRPRAEFLLVAPTLEVADLAFQQAVGMVEADKVLLAKCRIQANLKRITYRPTGAFLKVKSFDTKILTGSKPAGVLLDELHVIAEDHNADRIVGQLRGGLMSQPEGFLLMITTQSERAPAGVFRSELRKARAVRDGRLKLPTLAMLYEFPAGVDWRDPSNWHMVCPNLGRSITLERMETDFAGAVEAGEEELRRWASQHLDVEIGVALLADGWKGAHFWARQGRQMTLEDVIARSEVLTAGIDGGGLDDLLGVAVLGRERTTKRWLLWNHAWAHPVALERRKSERARYEDFMQSGNLTIIPELPGDVSAVAELFRRLNKTGKLASIGLDPEKTHKVMAAALLEAKIDAKKLFGIPQGWKLVGAITVAERKLAEGELEHCSQDLMEWAVANAKVEPKGNAFLITKQASGSAKIDPLMASFNAVELMSRNPAGTANLAAWARNPVIA